MGSCLQCQQNTDSQHSFMGSFNEYIEEQASPRVKSNQEQPQKEQLFDLQDVQLGQPIHEQFIQSNQNQEKNIILNQPANETPETPKKDKKYFTIKNECIWDTLKTKRKSVFQHRPLTLKDGSRINNSRSIISTYKEIDSIKQLDHDEIKFNENQVQEIQVSLQSPQNENIIIFDSQNKEEFNNNKDDDKPETSNAVNLHQNVIQIENLFIVKLLQSLEPIQESFIKDRLILGPQLQLTSGHIYIGQWLKGKRDGFGKQIYKDGHYYEGSWQNDLQNGYGRMISQNGDYYFGEYLNGFQNGKGITVLNDGSSHEGYWKGNQKNGDCKEIAIDGSVFTGSYSKGYREGKGKIDYQDGSIYIGEFKKGNIEGEGTQMWPDGRKYIGEWQDGKMHGQGKFLWAEDKWYQGEYKDNMRSGHGEYHWPDGRVYKGQWKNGVMHGQGIMIDVDSTIKKAIWKKGVLQPTKLELKKTQKNAKQKSKTSSKSISQLQYQQSRFYLTQQQIINTLKPP